MLVVLFALKVLGAPVGDSCWVMLDVLDEMRPPSSHVSHIHFISLVNILADSGCITWWACRRLLCSRSLMVRDLRINASA